MVNRWGRQRPVHPYIDPMTGPLRLPPTVTNICDVQTLGGAALVTFKLHLAACHLPDQVRTGGAAYFSLEFWVERMVQEYKGYIRGRGTGKPELLYVKDEVMSRACRRLRRERRGGALRLIQDAVRDVKARRRPRGARAILPRVMGDPCPQFSGAARPLTETQLQQLLPDYSGYGDLGGIGYVLQNAPELREEAGWPTFPELENADARRTAIAEAIGMGVAGNEGNPAVRVYARKFTRAVLSCGDSVCSTEYKGQVIKDDTWAMIRYLEMDEDGEETAVWYVAHIRLLVQTVLARLDVEHAAGWESDGSGHLPQVGAGVGVVGAAADEDVPEDNSHQSEAVSGTSTSDAAAGAHQGQRVGQSLAVAVADLFKLTHAVAPGVKEPAEDGRSPPSYVFVSNLKIPAGGPAGQNDQYAGTFAMLVSQIDAQLLPGEADGPGRYFSIASKASGRVRRVYGKFPTVYGGAAAADAGPGL